MTVHAGVSHGAAPSDGLGVLHRRYNGPVPEAERMAARLGGVRALRRSIAVAQAALYGRLARAAHSAVAARRASVAEPAGDLRLRSLVAELAQCRRRGLAWRDVRGED